MREERVLVLVSGKFLVGVFLDHYMVTFCPRGRSILHYLREAVSVHIEASNDCGVRPFEGFPKAPGNYQVLWAKAKRDFIIPLPGMGLRLHGRFSETQKEEKDGRGD